ncbi:MAG: stage 0 sporulation family protein [Planctomycetota bacterium]
MEHRSSASGKHSGKYYSFDPALRLKELLDSKTELWVVSCRYGNMGVSGKFFSTHSHVARSEDVIVKTELGVEIAFSLGNARPYEPADAQSDVPWSGEIERVAEKEDLARWEYIKDELEPAEFGKCVELIEQHGLPMKLVDVEHLFGGDRIIFYFLADNRVDFRALVRDLSKEFRTRIEMRQIGVRDEARLLANFEHCGRPLCCKTFIRELKPVTMKMAKQQKTTLDPAKISGRCGRLMCCLRFEDEVYCYLKEKLPRKGQIVYTKTNKGEVINVALVRESVLIRDENDNQLWVKVSDITRIVDREQGSSQIQNNGNSSNDRDNNRSGRES